MEFNGWRLPRRLAWVLGTAAGLARLGAASPSPRLTLVTARQAIRRGPPTRRQMPAHLCRSPARQVVAILDALPVP